MGEIGKEIERRHEELEEVEAPQPVKLPEVDPENPSRKKEEEETPALVPAE